MLPIIETERLILRPIAITDSSDFYHMNSNPKVNRYLRNPLTSIQDTENYILKITAEYQMNGIGRFAVVLKENNTLIGFSGLKFRKTEENNFSNFYDIGYRFSEAYWHKGYATEAAIAWLDYGWNTMQLSEIHACAASENIASNQLLQKIGFQYINSYVVDNLPHQWYTIQKR